jgi:hypothetical protein
MNKLVLILFSLLFVSTAAWAADESPKAEVFGGFSVLSIGGGERSQYYGFQASAAVNLHKNVGILADFGGQYGDGIHEYDYLFGPQFSIRKNKATVFAHALVGGDTYSDSSYSSTQFAMGFGGGLDVNLNKRIALRVVQFDWLPAHFEDGWDNSTIRFGFGLVFKK